MEMQNENNQNNDQAMSQNFASRGEDIVIEDPAEANVCDSCQ